MNKRVVTFGEIMLRLAPNGYYRFFQNDQLQATFGGGEANVAVSLANYGLDSVYVTKLPSHAIGQAAVNALRSSISASDNDWAGMLYDGEHYCFSKEYHLRIVDRVGGGDSFGGGLIYALLAGKDSQAAIEFAVAASALKHSIEGDFNRITVAEVEKLAGGDGSGRVQR